MEIIANNFSNLYVFGLLVRENGQHDDITLDFRHLYYHLMTKLNNDQIN